MIKKIKFSNFASFYDECEVSFEMNKKPRHSLYDIDLKNGERLNKVVSVVGANGSGKTQLLKPLPFLIWFLIASYHKLSPDEEVPYETHLLHEDEPTNFELNFIFDGEEYRYELTLQKSKVIREALYIKSSKLFSYIFIRELKNDNYEIKQKKFGFSRTLSEKTKSNSSLISAAYNFDVPFAKALRAYFVKFEYNIHLGGRAPIDHSVLFESAQAMHENKTLKKQMTELLCDLDLGLSDIQIKKMNSDEPGEEEILYFPIGIHQTAKGKFEVPFHRESNGTQSAMLMLSLILPVLNSGGVAIIDELDNDLHPHILEKVLDLFKLKETNPRQAQLIFSCHTPEVLNLLSKHQVYLVEKIDCESEAYRVDSIQGLRSDDNLYAKYFAGALGATPDI